MKKFTDLEEERMMKFQSIKEIVMRFMKKMKKDRVSAAAAESAFFVIMGFVPFFTKNAVFLRQCKQRRKQKDGVFCNYGFCTFFYASSDAASVYGTVSGDADVDIDGGASGKLL